MAPNVKKSSKKGQAIELSDDLLLSSSKNAKLIEDKHERIVAGTSKVLFKKGFHPTTTREASQKRAKCLWASFTTTYLQKTTCFICFIST